jgi:hypothetical protein
MNQSVATSSSSLTSAADFFGASEVLSPEKPFPFRMRGEASRAANSNDFTRHGQRGSSLCIHHSGSVGTPMAGMTSPSFECSRARCTRHALPSAKVSSSDGCHGMRRASLH